MVSYLVGTRCSWGILTNGRVWRLYSREVSSTASEFYEVDLDAIFGEDAPSHVGAGSPRPVAPSITPSGSRKNYPGVVTHRMGEETYAPTDAFRRAAFLPDARGRTFLQQVRDGSAFYAKRISDELKELVFDEVMPEIAGGFVAHRRAALKHEIPVRQRDDWEGGWLLSAPAMSSARPRSCGWKHSSTRASPPCST